MRIGLLATHRGSTTADLSRLRLAIDAESDWAVTVDRAVPVGYGRGALRSDGGLVFVTQHGTFEIKSIAFRAAEANAPFPLEVVEGVSGSGAAQLDLKDGRIVFDRFRGRLQWEAEFTIAAGLATAVGRPDVESLSLGGLR
jgi:hypothetical protein